MEWSKPDKEGMRLYQWLDRHRPEPPEITPILLKPRKYSPRNQWHARAENGAEEITHTCWKGCECHLDWRPFTTWRPWENPPASAVARLEQFGGFLFRELQWILDVHRSTAPRVEYNERRGL